MFRLLAISTTAAKWLNELNSGQMVLCVCVGVVFQVWGGLCFKCVTWLQVLFKCFYLALLPPATSTPTTPPWVLMRFKFCTGCKFAEIRSLIRV